MGGLVALHLALLRPHRVAALVLLAPAVGFAERRWARLGEEERAALLAGGRLSLNTDAAPHDAVGADFYQIAREFDLPTGPGSIPIRCPVRILHGLLDATVPLAVSHGLVTQIASDDATLQLVKGGEHKLTSPRDLVLLQSTVAGLVLQLQHEPGGDGGGDATADALEP
jgi:pimeloyl-ACP methyl ester carboxylesterase